MSEPPSQAALDIAIRWGEADDGIIELARRIDAALTAARAAERGERVVSAPVPGEEMRAVARAICKSRSFEGINCCQWPANRGRTKCPVNDGGYDDAAQAAIQQIETVVAERAREACDAVAREDLPGQHWDLAQERRSLWSAACARIKARLTLGDE